MWLRFTQVAKRAIFQAQREMRSFGHYNVTPEHLLIAILKSSDSEVADLIFSTQYPVQDLLDSLTRAISGISESGQRRPHLTPSARRAISLAFNYSSRIGEGYIGTRHLLVGLASDRSTEAGRLLTSTGLGMKAVHSLGLPDFREV